MLLIISSVAILPCVGTPSFLARIGLGAKGLAAKTKSVTPNLVACSNSPLTNKSTVDVAIEPAVFVNQP